MLTTTRLSVFVITTVLILMTSVVYADGKPETGSFREITRYQLGGEGGWDYLTVESEARRIYIARASRIMVVDADSGQIVGEVPGLEGAHGIAFIQERGLGFATSGKSGEVVVFDLKTLKVLDKIKAGDNPDAIVYNSATNRILAFNGKSHSATVIDPTTRKVVGTIPLAGKPEFAVSDDSANVFVDLEDKSELLEISPSLLKIVATYPLAPCEEPTGLSIDLKTKRLIVGCRNKLSVIVDGRTGTVVQNFKVGGGVDAAAFDSEHRLAFVSAGEGLLTVLSEDKAGFQVLQNIPTVHGARTLAVDQKTGRVFLPIARFEPSVPSVAGQAHARPSVIAGTFALLVVGKKD